VTEHDATAYGRAAAATYDDHYDGLPDTRRTVDALAEHARGGAILEFGIGTGRLALPLAARGLEVAGIDASPEMLDQLAAKPGAEALTVVLGDFADTRIEGTFAVAVVSFNTIFALESREAQLAAFRNAAAHLRPGGRVVLEAYVLDPVALRGEPSLRARFVTGAGVELEALAFDPATGFVDRTVIRLASGAPLELVPVRDCYADPADLDALAARAGLERHSREGGWSGEPFDEHSRRHVSVWERAE
jgi:SAM-dependent methyltransferase